MHKIGIISGGGKLPILIGKQFINKGNTVIFFCVEPYTKKIDYNNYENVNIKLESVSEILKKLKSKNIQYIIMAGFVKRPSIKDIKFDYKTLKLIKDYTLQPKGDDKLLLTISKFLNNEGFEFLNWKKHCRNLFINEENITKKLPNKISIENLNKGLKIYQKLGKIDLCQSLIIQNNLVLGVEAAEGTDELIKRCSKYKTKGDKGILLKLSKYNQDSRFDVPVIGYKTLKLLKKYDYEGVFIEKNSLILLDKSKCISFANDNSLFISGVKKFEK